MTDLQKELDRAFKLLSTIPVSGDGVELMSEVRRCLRTAYGMTGKQSEGCEDG